MKKTVITTNQAVERQIMAMRIIHTVRHSPLSFYFHGHDLQPPNPRAQHLRTRRNMNPFTAKIVLLGADEVGKTSLVQQFIYNYFIETSYRKQLIVDNRMCYVEIEIIHEYEGDLDPSIWGTSLSLLPELSVFSDEVQERAIQDGQAFLLIYAISARMTFERLEEFRQRAVSGKGTTAPPMVVVGNKCDTANPQREVSKEEGAELAVRLGIPFVETSAMTAQNVERVFVNLVRALLERAPPAIEPDGRSGGRRRCIVL
ncbi:P-loop containing nucleoside triphosphate hydrolase protein [Mycena capillaripes]|nr:P-loop containing nucleoside triphosphate hydrolase protein [Mycena capillaripes]